MQKILIVLLLGVIGCGGGGGGDDGSDGTPFFAGRWRGDLVKVLDSCPEGIRSFGSFDYDVNQVDRSIVVDNNGNGTTFTGDVDDDNQGFLVTGDPIRSEGCTGIPGISFDDLDGDTANVTFLGILQCGDFQCEFAFSGRGLRE